ncbi:DciA family protein [Herbiconiux moechotypicola]|uniref:DciA family protein n=1 Tax=Herbiconiux moechotypicola TaxID=637393 RepID=A0ABP5Q4X9_9MICO|nr:DciA family protein [Herbiconiux moechotypicola]MCS5728892.1 DciA family protein [Herbiconiux moechotypicola]
MSEAQAVYLRLKAAFGNPDARAARWRERRSRTGGDDEASVPYGVGRDPKGLGDVMSGLSTELGWGSSLAKSDLLLAWAEIAGPDTAAHSTPLGITDSVLTVQCESTAWATQLRQMRVLIMTTIAQRFPEAGIESIRFEAPHAPSWKRGSRSIPGRGPRDTYG